VIYNSEFVHRRFLVPEVVQSSAMDCGPATLKCLLEGFGIPVSYGRLREACQTDLDGTSINTMEEVAGQLGLESEQVMVPVDQLLLPEARTLPAIVVVRQPNGLTHFIVVWRRHGPYVEVMDPAIGRRWLTCKQLLSEVYVHLYPVPAVEWRDWAASEEFLNPFHRRLANLRLPRKTAKTLTDAALEDRGWESLAALDAAVRMVDLIVRSGGVRTGNEAGRVLQTLSRQARAKATDDDNVIPARYWSVRPAEHEPGGEVQLKLRGAVLVRVRRRRSSFRRSRPGAAKADGASTVCSPELVVALNEKSSRTGSQLLRLLRADGLFGPAALIVALAFAAAGIVVEALLLRGIFELSRDLTLTEQRLTAMGSLLIFVVALLLVEVPIAAGLLRIGRRLEAKMRVLFLEKIPRLGDRYFRSRLTSDMAERGHVIHGLRLLPEVGGRLIRAAFELILTTLGIAWLDPPSAPLAFLAAGLALGLPFIFHPSLSEQDLRVRTHAGALSRYYLDALLGIVAIRAHAAERSVRREHEGLLSEWVRASLTRGRTAVALEGAQSLVGFGLAAWLVLNHLARANEGSSVLLLVYWAFNLPVLGLEVALFVRQYPAFRNMTTRLLEPLGAPEEVDEPGHNVESVHGDSCHSSAGVSLLMEDVSVRAAGHTILEGIGLAIEAGSHVAIVGPSGAGKSSLVGLLLGWHRSASGRILVDDRPFTGEQMTELRKRTAWVDPSVQLWNRSLLENLRYGTVISDSAAVGDAIELADLRNVLEKLPDGLQTRLGEGGALVSGGEGQRVRLGRAMLRQDVRLVILDEPFRGLQRDQRQDLLGRARRLWRNATLLCITHDVSETLAFERVLLIEGGQIIEDGNPQTLAGCAESRYSEMLKAERALREELSKIAAWRRLHLAAGELIEEGGKRTTQ
jgi:ATP-binding cassette subfamily B protein